MKLRELIGTLVCVALTLPGLAQGGQGGFGGIGGGMMGRGSDADVSRATNILTPGQFTEYALTVKEGEVVLAHVETDNFDSALQVTDAAGKVLAENDDAKPGEQNPRLLYRFPKGGEYKLLVRAFKGASGGQFDLLMRRFLPSDLKPGVSITDQLPGLSYLRIAANAGQTFLFHASQGIPGETTLYSPTGESVSISQRPDHQQGLWFRAETAGDYYLRLGVGTPGTLTMNSMRVLPFQPGGQSVEQVLKPTEGDLWRFTGKKGELVRLSVTTPGNRLMARLRYLPTPGKSELVPAPTILNGNPKDEGYVAALLQKDGTYELAVYPPGDKAETRYKLASRLSANPWNSDAQAGVLPRGGTEFWLLEGTAGDLLRLEASSEAFDVTMDLLELETGATRSNDDREADTNALLIAQLTRTGKYLLRVQCYGHGGGGAYQLRRSSIPARALVLNTRVTGTLVPQEPGIWSFTGKAGQAILLNVRSQAFDSEIRLNGPDGVLLAQNDNGGDGTNSLLSVRLPKEGTYTIWVTGKGGKGDYILRLLDAD